MVFKPTLNKENKSMNTLNNKIIVRFFKTTQNWTNEIITALWSMFQKKKKNAT